MWSIASPGSHPKSGTSLTRSCRTVSAPNLFSAWQVFRAALFTLPSRARSCAGRKSRSGSKRPGTSRKTRSGQEMWLRVASFTPAFCRFDDGGCATRCAEMERARVLDAGSGIVNVGCKRSLPTRVGARNRYRHNRYGYRFSSLKGRFTHITKTVLEFMYF